MSKVYHSHGDFCDHRHNAHCDAQGGIWVVRSIELAPASNSVDYVIEMVFAFHAEHNDDQRQYGSKHCEVAILSARLGDPPKAFCTWRKYSPNVMTRYNHGAFMAGEDRQWEQQTLVHPSWAYSGGLLGI